MLAGEDNRRPAHHALQLRKGDDRSRKGDGADSGADAHLDQARNTNISGRADAVGSRFEKRRGSNANRRQSDQAMKSRDQFG